MARGARGRGSCDGIHRAVLAARVGSVGAVLAADSPAAGGPQSDVGHAAPGPGPVESRAARAEAGFPRCRTVGQAAGGAGADPQLCARRGATALADGDAPKVPGDTQSSPVAEPVGGPAGGGAYQGVEPRVGSARRQYAPDAAGPRGWRNR